MLRVTQLGGFGIGQWTPWVAGADFWIDPSNLATCKQEITGASATTPSGVGDPVGSIRNLGRSGGWATSPTTSDRPILRTSAGVYWLEFDGAGDGYNLPSVITAPKCAAHGFLVAPSYNFLQNTFTSDLPDESNIRINGEEWRDVTNTSNLGDFVHSSGRTWIGRASGTATFTNNIANVSFHEWGVSGADDYRFGKLCLEGFTGRSWAGNIYNAVASSVAIDPLTTLHFLARKTGISI
jgi:hypothetical protein